MTLMRAPSSFRSRLQPRAKLRTAALDAEYTLPAAMPLTPAMEEFRMIDAPGESKGSAFCTVKSSPLTLALKSRS